MRRSRDSSPRPSPSTIVSLARRRALSLAVVAAAIGTAALENAGIDEWWVVPAALLGILGLSAARRARPPR